MPGSSYATAPRVLKAFIDELVQDIVGTCARTKVRLESILLHGSLAMGCFYVPKSDVDSLVIVDDLSEAQSATLYDLFKRHHDKRPCMGGLEASVIRSREAQKPTRPTLLLSSFSEQTSGPPQRVAGTLPRSDTLLMNAVVPRTRGAALWGAAPDVALGEVSRADFPEAVRHDRAGVLAAQAVLRSPFLAVLNLCCS